MKKIIAMLLAGLMLFSFAACGGDGNETADEADTTVAAGEDAPETEAPETEAAGESDFAYITEKGKLIVGITDYAPMDYRDEKGEWTGFDAEFARLTAEKLGVEVEFIEIDWDNKFMELRSKGIDCIWNGMTITEEALLNADVSDPYVKNAQVVVMSKDALADYTTVESLSELTFAAETGSAGAKALEDNKLDYVEVAAQTDALLEVKSGAVDACVIDITMANAMTGEGTSYANLGYSLELTTEEYGIAFRQGSDLTAKVNEIMAGFKADGTLDALAAEYELTLA